MSKQPPPAPTASAIGPCPTIIQNVGRPGTESLPSTFAPPKHPFSAGTMKFYTMYYVCIKPKVNRIVDTKHGIK